MSDIKALIAASSSPENAGALTELLKRQAEQASPPPQVDLEPVLEQIRAMSEQIGRLEASASQQPQTVDRVVEKDNPKTQEELVALRQKLASTSDQYDSCRRDLGTLEVKLEEATKTATRLAAVRPERQQASTDDPASVVLFDRVLLKRAENKTYGDVDVDLKLQSITSRSAQVAVNQQNVGISFGERKIFQHRDVTCELVLMETDLEGGQARFSIACKR